MPTDIQTANGEPRFIFASVSIHPIQVKSGPRSIPVEYLDQIRNSKWFRFIGFRFVFALRIGMWPQPMPWPLSNLIHCWRRAAGCFPSASPTGRCPTLSLGARSPHIPLLNVHSQSDTFYFYRFLSLICLLSDLLNMGRLLGVHTLHFLFHSRIVQSCRIVKCNSNLWNDMSAEGSPAHHWVQVH